MVECRRGPEVIANPFVWSIPLIVHMEDGTLYSQERVNDFQLA